MKGFFQKKNLLIAIAAILYVITFYYGLSLLAWIFLAPLVYAITPSGRRSLFRAGLLYGALIGIGGFHSMPQIIAGFAGEASLLGWLFSLVAILICAAFFGFVLYVYGLLQKDKYPVWVQAILLASVWTFFEALSSYVFEGMPWFSFQVGNLLLSSLYFIQPAEWGGLFLLSFIVVFVNAWIGLILAKSQVKQLWQPAVVFIGYTTICFLLLQQANRLEKDNAGQSVAVAIMCENTAPEEKWSNDNGPQMVKHLLALNQQANALKPDVVVWTESAVPWTFRSDDDFVKEVFKNAAASNAIQLLGINSAYDSSMVYNSVYCLLPDGKVSGRYDKRFLLSLAEKPISFLSLPFLNSTDGFSAKEGQLATPLPTPKGKIGVLICNESFVPASAIDMANNGADYLVNISNDGWFSGVAFMRDFHFNSARLRAVEVRRDMAVNSNLGISGKIAATGMMTDVRQGDEGFVSKVVLTKGNYKTLMSKFPNLSLIVISILIVLFAFMRFFFK